MAEKRTLSTITEDLSTEKAMLYNSEKREVPALPTTTDDLSTEKAMFYNSEKQEVPAWQRYHTSFMPEMDYSLYSPPSKSMRPSSPQCPPFEPNYIPIWRQPNFYLDRDTRRLTTSHTLVRKFYSEENGIYNIHWAKSNVGGFKVPRYGRRDSHQRVSIVDCAEFRSHIKTLVSECRATRYCDELPRHAGNPLAKITNINNPDFWDASLSLALDSGRLILRQWRATTGGWTIRILMPQTSENNPGWLGPVCTFSLSQSYEFEKALGEEQEKIDNLEAIRIQKLWEEVTTIHTDKVVDDDMRRDKENIKPLEEGELEEGEIEQDSLDKSD